MTFIRVPGNRGPEGVTAVAGVRECHTCGECESGKPRVPLARGHVVPFALPSWRGYSKVPRQVAGKSAGRSVKEDV
jgi:hypothetical protein